MSERVAELGETVQFVQRQDAVRQKLDVLLLDRQHESAHDGVVDRQDLVHAGHSVVEKRDVAQHLAEHVANQRAALAELAVEVVQAETDHRPLAQVLGEQQILVLADEGVGDDQAETVDTDLRTGDLASEADAGEVRA